jgi:hypothetical protein
MSAIMTRGTSWQTTTVATYKRIVGAGNNQFWYEDI